MQFLLAIFQTHRDIRRPFGPPKKIEVIAEALPLIDAGDCAVKPILPLKNDGRILKHGSFLVRRIVLAANLVARIVRSLTRLESFLTHEEELCFSKLKVWVQCNRQRGHFLEDLGFLACALPGHGNNEESQKQKYDSKSHLRNKAGH